MDRRNFLKAVAATAASALLAKSLPKGVTALAGEAAGSADTAGAPVVYMTRDISPAGLLATYRALGHGVEGRVAVKLSLGEPGGHNYLSPDLIKGLVQSVNGVFVDSNTAYGGKRDTAESHLKVARDHGFAAVAPMDVLDAESEIELPIARGKHLQAVRVGGHFPNYDSYLVLSHFKGHAMAGYGGALKNIAIGISSRAGKCLVHTAGRSAADPFDGPDKQEDFLESMAEASQGMISAVNGKMLFINVMNRMSIDCDCSANPAEPEMRDIGILSSLDPVALDKASLDLVYAADARESASLRRRIEEKNGAHILVHAERIGIGRQQYRLVNLDS